MADRVIVLAARPAYVKKKDSDPVCDGGAHADESAQCAGI